MKSSMDRLNNSLKVLSEVCEDFYLNKNISEISGTPDPFSFYKDWVAPNKPVIIKSAIKHWPAFRKWNNDYLRSVIGENEITATVTPNGYADAPFQSYFALPEERMLNFSSFLDIMERKENPPGIFYVQKQNSNLTDEFSALLEDVEAEIQWFSKALGKSPDAMNFWIGDERAITSMHKDNYENIYCVIRGYKDFILLPPTDLPYVPYKMYPPGKFKMDSNGLFDIEPMTTMDPVPWICIDPLNPDFKTYPQYRNAHPVKCRVHEGDALYLPSLWFHHVQQSHSCIAVNYWHDMDYDLKYIYYKFLQSLTCDEIPLEI